MKQLLLLKALVVGFLFVMALAKVGGAAECGVPVPAPKWQIGDTWTFQDELGDERTETVVGYEGEFTIVERGRTLNRTLLYYDEDRVLRKVVAPDGTVVDKADQSTWRFLGLKTVDFPLDIGKTWSFPFIQEGHMYSRVYRAMGCEEVTVSAGKFSALKIEITTKRLGARRENVRHEWYAPAVKQIIRGRYRRQDQEGKGFEWELLRYRVK